MLNIYFGDMPEAIYNTSVYFRNTYKDKWITTELSREMIRQIRGAQRNTDTVADFRADASHTAFWRCEDAHADCL